ncbi:Pentatricopeptide repeat [Dillenia turbinata]|uniref:Pentatricopeptide repeat n=1 Tax=Dillenia turbinata TaxID=194707 RepID=A0AAN8YWQ1_9MAGN
MYMKCGCVENALEVFHAVGIKGISSYNAVIIGQSMRGMVEKSLQMFSEMKRSGVEPNEITFLGVLGACRLDLLGRAGLLKEAEELIESMPWLQMSPPERNHDADGVMKTPVCSLIEANGIAHEFLVGDETHPQTDEIETKLDEIAKKLKLEGYTPITTEVSLDIYDEEKETALFRHGEKLAIAFGLIFTVQPMKNLRI